MLDMKIVKAFNAAIVNEDNWDANGINWDFVDADMFMEVNPTKEQVAKFYRMFDDLAKLFVGHWSGINTYDNYIDAKEEIDKEYREIFGVVA